MNIEAEARPSLTPREKSGGLVLGTSGGQDEVMCVILSVSSEGCLVKIGRGGGNGAERSMYARLCDQSKWETNLFLPTGRPGPEGAVCLGRVL